MNVIIPPLAGRRACRPPLSGLDKQSELIGLIARRATYLPQMQGYLSIRLFVFYFLTCAKRRNTG